MKPVFFYGLFMDEDLLRDKGFHPRNVSHACLMGYQLKIGERATLVPDKQACSYGTVMELDSDELQKLYGSDGVEDYIPCEVNASLTNGEALEVTSYILPEGKISGSNSEYAINLASIAQKLELPDFYIDEIKTWI